MSVVEINSVSTLKNVAEHVMNLENLLFQIDVLSDVLKYFVNLSKQQQNVPTLVVGKTKVKQVSSFLVKCFEMKTIKYRLPGIDFILCLFSFKGSAGCQNKESYCELARPDCKTSRAMQDCKKYCGLCQTSSCVNKEPWCEAAKPDCTTSFAKKNCKKYCGLCGGKKLNRFTK